MAQRQFMASCMPLSLRLVNALFDGTIAASGSSCMRCMSTQTPQHHPHTPVPSKAIKAGTYPSAEAAYAAALKEKAERAAVNLQTSADAPPVPKVLGFAGAIPFLSTTPAMVEAVGLYQHVDYLAQVQLMYGGIIVSFLGAVHWGLALAVQSPLGRQATSALRERYTWSVVPGLAAVPALLLQPAQGSFAIAILLFLCYLSDRGYAKAGILPAWYLHMRGRLTALAMLGMLSTTAYYFFKDLEKAKARMAADEAKAADKAVAAAATRTEVLSAPELSMCSAPSVPAVEAPASSPTPAALPTKKRWW